MSLILQMGNLWGVRELSDFQRSYYLVANEHLLIWGQFSPNTATVSSQVWILFWKCWDSSLKPFFFLNRSSRWHFIKPPYIKLIVTGPGLRSLWVHSLMRGTVPTVTEQGDTWTWLELSKGEAPSEIWPPSPLTRGFLLRDQNHTPGQAAVTKQTLRQFWHFPPWLLMCQMVPKYYFELLQVH